MLQDDSQPFAGREITRRAALQIGAAAGAAAIVVPRLGGLGGRRAVDISDALPTAANPAWPVPAMITRAQWGAPENLRKGGQIYDSVVTHIVVHHTGTPNDITNYAGLCRGIMINEVRGEYIDVAYNWLIDPNGHIYEGRWAQNYAAGVPHTGERNGANVRGGHAIYHNTRTIGVALMGNYDDTPPPAAMLDGLVTLLAWKCARWGLDPMARATYVTSTGRSETLYRICGHRDTSATACPGGRTEALLPTIRARVAARLTGAGYWIASRSGPVAAFGGALRGPQIHPVAPISGITRPPRGSGYWLGAQDGGVYAIGARFFGGLSGKRLPGPVIDIAATTTGNGYWLLASDGSIFAFGDAKFYGSTRGMRLNAPLLGITATPTGKGYWVYARDGGIFSYGDAKFYGSTGGIRLVRPVVSMAARPQGDGYWMIAEDGGVFSFGKAPFRGSGANERTTSPCVAMQATTTGNGYAMLRRDGSVSTFGDAPNLGNARGRLFDAVGIAGKLQPVS